jgi:hypothetical protein
MAALRDLAIIFCAARCERSSPEGAIVLVVMMRGYAYYLSFTACL